MDPTCIADARKRPTGQMFWGSFNGTEKGPTLIWNRVDYGSIDAAGYRDRIVPLIRGWIQQWRLQHAGEELFFMQDNAPVHTATIVIQELRESGIQLVDWPPYSLDLNPIEHVWAWMKDWINIQWPEARNTGYILMEQIEQAWAAIPSDFLHKLLESMPERCQQVIRAQGRHSEY